AAAVQPDHQRLSSGARGWHEEVVGPRAGVVRVGPLGAHGERRRNQHQCSGYCETEEEPHVQTNAEPSQSLLRRGYAAAVPITRREAIRRGAALTLASSAAVSEAKLALSRSALAASTAAATVPLPSPRQVRADFQRMVDFGPRLTGTQAHPAFIAWPEAEFAT